MDKKSHDLPIIVVGAGLSGATMARKFAEDGERVIVVDKRDHIGGNTYEFFEGQGGEAGQKARGPRPNGYLTNTR